MYEERWFSVGSGVRVERILLIHGKQPPLVNEKRGLWIYKAFFLSSDLPFLFFILQMQKFVFFHESYNSLNL